jgi:hypothetical protein
MELRLVFQLQAAEAVVVGADVAEDLRGDLVVGIEALKLILEIDALEALGLDEVADAGGNFRRDAAGDPGKAVAVGEAVGDLLLGW